MRHFLALALLVCCCWNALSQSVEEMGAAASAGDWHRVEAMAVVRTRRAPADAVGWTFLGLAESNLGKNEQALSAFARSVRLSPGEAASHTNYGAALERAGRKQEAAGQYARSLKINPKQPPALVNLARLDAETGDVGKVKALGLLRQAWALAPDAEIAASLLVLGSCRDAGQDGFVGRVAEGEMDASLRLQAGHALEVCGQWADAERVFRAALASDPGREARETALLGVARAEVRQGRADAAETGLIAAVQAGYETPRLLSALGDVEQQRGHFELAVPALLRAVTLAPADEDLRFRYGMLLLDTRTPKAAEVRTVEALKRFPESARLWFLLGLSYFDQDETALARDAFDRSLKLDGKFSAALAYRGMTAAGEQHYSEAEGYFRRAIAAEPGSAELHLLLADALEKEHPEDVGPAYAELERAVKMDPECSRAYLMMGRIDLDRGKPEQAVAELKKALELRSSEEQAHFFLARAYRQTHQPRLAAEEGEMYARLAAASRTRERDAVEQAVRQLGQTRF